MSLSLVDDVQHHLETDRFGHTRRGFEEVDSTNTRAAEWAREGAPEGSVVITEYQSAGRGRHGRAWSAQKGQNLMFSVVLRPHLSADRLGLVTVAAGVAVAEAIETFVTPHRAALKWPNDVLLESRKVCGMLLESSLSSRRSADRAAEVVVLGVGLNVNQTTFPPELEDTATSLRLVAGRTIPRVPLLAHLLQALERRYDAVQAGEDASVRSAFLDRLDMLGEQMTVRLTESDEQLSGTVRGITDTGALRLETDDGLQVVRAGEATTQ